MTNTKLLELADHFRKRAWWGDSWTTMPGAGFAAFDSGWITVARYDSFDGMPGDSQWYESVAQVCESLAYDNTDGPS